MTDLFQDLRYAVRTLGRNPGFASASILTLATGIAVATAIFSVADGVLLKPLPYADAARLVSLSTKVPGNAFGISPGQFITFENSDAFDGVGAFFAPEMTLTGRGLPERLRVGRASSSFFPVLGVTPVIGRNSQSEEEVRLKTAAALISHRMWTQRFGGKPDVLGQTLTLNGEPTLIGGVLPPTFRTPREVFFRGEIDVWLPLQINRAQPNWASHFLTAIGRLPPGIPLERAQAELDIVQDRVKAEHPELNVPSTLAVTPLLDDVLGTAKGALWLLVGSVALVLLIATANVAGLLLIRSQTRQQEMAVRAALGAGRWPVLRQLLAESFVVAGIGTALGVLLASGILEILPQVVASTLPRLDNVVLDGRTLLFAIAVQVMMTVTFGSASALYVARHNLFSALRVGVQTDSRSRARGREILVVAQVALTVVLVVGAGLMLRSFGKILQIDPGFDPSGMLTARVSPRNRPVPPAEARAAQERMTAFYDELLGSIRRLPGVTGTAAVNVAPLAGHAGDTVFDIEGRAPALQSAAKGSQLFQYANQRWVTPEYFRIMGIPVLQGRAFSEADRMNAPGVIVINRQLADRFWPSQNPVGQRMRMYWNLNTTGPWLQIVGVVANSKRLAMTDEFENEMIHPFAQAATNSGATSMATLTLVVRTTNDPATVVEPIRKLVAELDPDAPVYDVQKMQHIVETSVAQPRLSAMLVSLFSTIALALAVLGLYSVVAYAVAQRTREFGVRIALGATRTSLIRLVLKHGLRLALFGTLLGIGGAYALAGVLATQLYGTTPSDVVSTVTVSVVLASAMLMASYFPARRAAKVNPMTALRTE